MEIAQATSDSVLLTVALEVFAVVAEVFEARDLLRLDTPLERNKKTIAQIRQASKGFRSSRIRIATTNDEESNGPAYQNRPIHDQAANGEETNGDLDLRVEFCSRVLITTQLAESE